VKQGISAELARLAAEPVPAGELTTARRLLGAEYTFSNETVAERVSTLGFYEAIDSYRTASLYPSLVRSITAADVAGVAARYAGEPVWVTMKPGEQR
jgi:predicted Zn-dependent peptidase